jgi:hypothetical protein
MSAKASVWPTWVYQADCPADYFCAVGIAPSEALAKKIAFNDLSHQLQVSVNSQSLVSMSKKDNKSSSALSQKIKLTTESIPLNLVPVVDKAFQNNQVALFIKLSKQQFYNNLSARVTTFFDNISTSEQLIRQPLWQQRIWAIKQLTKQAKIENQLSLLTALNRQKTLSSGLWQKFKQWQQLTLALKDKAIIEVQASHELKTIATIINQSLIGGSGNIYWLQPTMAIKSAKKSGEYIVQASLHLELLESEPPYRVLFSNSLKAQKSAPTFNTAKQKAIGTITHLIEASKGQVLFSNNNQHHTKEYQ